MEHQDDASDREGNKKQARDPSQTEGIRKLEPVAFHLCREDVEEEVIENHHGPFQIGIRKSRSEDGSPDERTRDGLKDFFLHGSSL